MSSETLYFIDGVLSKLTAEELALFNPANKNTHGVFETLRSYNGKLFKLDEHLKRLQKSSELLQFTLPFSLPILKSFLESSVLKSAPQTPLRIKCVATPTHFLIESSPLRLNPEIYNGVAAVSRPMERSNPLAKALPYNLSFEAHRFAEQNGAYESILIAADGTVTEGAYSNLFWVKKGTLFTREDKILEGITRQVILELFPVTFQSVTLEELKKMDEVFLTKTTTGPVPIIQLDGSKIGTGESTVYKEIRRRFEEQTL